MPVNSELLTTLLAPIPGDNPAGSDMRYDPQYDTFKEARREELAVPDKDGNMLADRKVPDWNRAAAIGTQLLNKSTKDLQLAAWMTEVLLQRQGVSGLHTGIELLRGILEQYWDTCYPEGEDGDFELRSGPLEWIGNKLTLPLQQLTIASGGLSLLNYNTSRGIPTEVAISAADYETQKSLKSARSEAEALGKTMPEAADAAIENTGKVFYKVLVVDIDTAVAGLAALEAMSDDRFGREAPAYTGLRNGLVELRRFAGSTLARKLELDPDPIEEVFETEASGVADTPSDGPQTPEPVNKQDAAQRVIVVAKWLRGQDATSPAPYAMLRAFRWGELRVRAPDLDPRLLEAPATPMRARLKSLLLDNRWADLLEQCEGLMGTAQGRGWLDLQRYSLTACANLGSGFDPVAAIIRSELQALLRALPQLPGMTLMDDTPSANDETKAWLSANGLDAPPEAAEAEVASADDSAPDSAIGDGAELLGEALADDEATASQGGLRATRQRRAPVATGRDPFDIARAELSAGRPNKAIERLMTELARDQSERGRFVRQTQIAYIMVEAGLNQVAEPILERLLEIIDDRKLEDWEAGALVAQPLALMHTVLTRTDDDSARRYKLYLRICRLDPLQALALQQG
ncbi:type VI secretion system protein TssA [Gemmatimonas sp.]